METDVGVSGQSSHHRPVVLQLGLGTLSTYKIQCKTYVDPQRHGERSIHKAGLPGELELKKVVAAIEEEPTRCSDTC
jgi:hypothetical protein